MRHVNKKWRNKDRQTNVLAFLLDASVGEVFINPYEAEREARQAGESYSYRVAYLFLHGLLHVYGYDHETEQSEKNMQKKEKELLRRLL